MDTGASFRGFGEHLFHDDFPGDRGIFQTTPCDFRSTATAKLEKVQGAGYRFTEVVIKPTVVIASAQDLAKTPRILEKAKENCFVTNAIKIAIKLEPEIFHHQTQTSPCPLG